MLLSRIVFFAALSFISIAHADEESLVRSLFPSALGNQKAFSYIGFDVNTMHNLGVVYVGDSLANIAVISTVSNSIIYQAQAPFAPLDCFEESFDVKLLPDYLPPTLSFEQHCTSISGSNSYQTYFYIWENGELKPIGPKRRDLENGGYTRQVSSGDVIKLADNKLEIRQGDSRVESDTSVEFSQPQLILSPWPKSRTIFGVAESILEERYGATIHTGVYSDELSLNFVYSDRAGSILFRVQGGDADGNHRPDSVVISDVNNEVIYTYVPTGEATKFFRRGAGGTAYEFKVKVNGPQGSVATVSAEEPGCDLNQDGHIDLTDIALISSAVEEEVLPNDPRDQNGNGVIDDGFGYEPNGDVYRCKLDCTENDCSTEWSSGADPTPTPTSTPTPTATSTPTITPTPTFTPSDQQGPVVVLLTSSIVDAQLAAQLEVTSNTDLSVESGETLILGGSISVNSLNISGEVIFGPDARFIVTPSSAVAALKYYLITYTVDGAKFMIISGMRPGHNTIDYNLHDAFGNTTTGQSDIFITTAQMSPIFPAPVEHSPTPEATASFANTVVSEPTQLASPTPTPTVTPTATVILGDEILIDTESKPSIDCKQIDLTQKILKIMSASKSLRDYGIAEGIRVKTKANNVDKLYVAFAKLKSLSKEFPLTELKCDGIASCEIKSIKLSKAKFQKSVRQLERTVVTLTKYKDRSTKLKLRIMSLLNRFPNETYQCN